MSDSVLWCQGLALLWNIVSTSALLLLSLPIAIVRCCFKRIDETKNCWYYEGTVHHVRRKPVHHAFRYPVRMAVLDLDDPPSWFAAQAHDHLTADAARQLCETQGKVKLLTHPRSAGYIQNPISVYYGYTQAGQLQRCIAEVTNTPWGERVTFAFDPAGDTVSKSLHVSPLMDMKGSWTLKTADPDSRLTLSVRVDHPEMGQFFDASLTAKRCTGHQAHLPNEHAGLGTLWRYGYQPHRVALWIYWEAVQLLRKGVPFYGPPSKQQRAEIEKKNLLEDASGRRHFTWRDATGFPWRT